MTMITDSETTRVWWLPGVVVPADAAKVTALTTGIDITCMLTRASELPHWGDDKTTSEDMVCGSLEIKAIIGSTVVDGSLVLVHDFNGTILSSTDPTTIFTGAQEQGSLVIRSGPRITVAATATTQKVDVYPVSAGKFQKSRFKDGFLKGTVKLYALAEPKENLTLAA